MDVLIPVVLAGAQTVGVNKARFQMPFNGEIITVTGACGTAPTGAALIYDCNVAGATVFTTQSRRPTFDVGESIIDVDEVNRVAESGLFVYGALVTIDCDQIGSSVAGSDVTLLIHLQRR